MQKMVPLFRSDESFIPVIIPTEDTAMATTWTIENEPVNCNDETDGRYRDAGTTLKGVWLFRL